MEGLWTIPGREEIFFFASTSQWSFMDDLASHRMDNSCLPLISDQYQAQKYTDVYIFSPRRLHGVVLTQKNALHLRSNDV
jgi:hypothetical protein